MLSIVIHDVELCIVDHDIMMIILYGSQNTEWKGN